MLDVRGPSPDYTEIGAAVVAAQDGEVIRIWPGTYQPFSINDKSLTLVRALDSGVVEVDGTFRVKNLAPQRSVSISGVNATGSDGYALVVSDCQGSVRLRESILIGASSSGGFPWNGGSALFVLNCADVELVDCSVRGGFPATGEYGGYGGDGLRVQASNLSLYASSITGTSGTTDDDPGASGGGGGSGVVAWGGGRVYLSGCSLFGGHGGDADWDIDFWTGEYGYGGSGGDGFVDWDGTVEAWFLDSLFVPGLGGSSPDSSHDGYDGVGHTPGTLLAGESRVLRTSTLVDDQASIAVSFEGAPGDLAYLQVYRAPDYTFDAQRGPFLIARPSAPQLLPWRILGTIGAGGTLQATVLTPDLPALGQRTFHLQGLVLGSESYYSSSSWTVLLDAAW